MTSASESSSPPNSLLVPVMRAMRPSSRSSRMAQPISGAASWYWPWNVRTMAQNPRKRFPVVNRLGRMAIPRLNPRLRSSAPFVGDSGSLIPKNDGGPARGPPCASTVRSGPPGPRSGDALGVGVGPGLTRDRLHPILQLQLLLLERNLLDLLVVAQYRLLAQQAQALLVAVVLLFEPAVLLVLLKEALLGGARVLGHRHLPKLFVR